MQEAIGQRAFAVVDVCNDAEIADVVHAYETESGAQKYGANRPFCLRLNPLPIFEPACEKLKSLL
jgi:hypothetical protein